MGGWVGGWVGRLTFQEETLVGGWVGGWVGELTFEEAVESTVSGVAEGCPMYGDHVPGGWVGWWVVGG